MPTRQAHARWEGSISEGKGKVDATAQVTVAPQDGGFRITKSHLVCEAKVPGIDPGTFVRHAETAKTNCPVSQALAGTEITLEARLAAK